jgi:hypothetical protein
MKFHAREVVAVALSGIPPAAKTIFEMVFHHRNDVISIMQIFSMVFSVILLCVTNNPKIMLMKDSCTTFLFGSLYLLSLMFCKEDLFFQFRRQLSLKSTEEMDNLWSLPQVRKASRFICFIWGLVMICEAGLRVVLVLVLPVDVMVYLTPFLGFFIFGPMAFCSIRYVHAHEPESLEPLLKDFDGDKINSV